MNAGLAPCLVCRNSQPSWADGIRLKLARRCPKLSSTPPTRPVGWWTLRQRETLKRTIGVVTAQESRRMDMDDEDASDF